MGRSERAGRHDPLLVMLSLRRKMKEADEVQSRALWVLNDPQGRLY